MQPVLFRIPVAGGIPVYTWPVVILLLVLVTYWLGRWWAKRRGIPAQSFDQAAILLFLVALVVQFALWGRTFSALLIAATLAAELGAWLWRRRGAQEQGGIHVGPDR
jgi:hypothetical protein